MSTKKFFPTTSKIVVFCPFSMKIQRFWAVFPLNPVFLWLLIAKFRFISCFTTILSPPNRKSDQNWSFFGFFDLKNVLFQYLWEFFLSCFQSTIVRFSICAAQMVRKHQENVVLVFRSHKNKRLQWKKWVCNALLIQVWSLYERVFSFWRSVFTTNLDLPRGCVLPNSNHYM